MRESTVGPPGGELSRRAALYTAGKLDAAQAAAFEEQLGVDAAAQTALCRAVQRTLAPSQGGALRPNPAYRKRVRRRLRRWRARAILLRRLPRAVVCAALALFLVTLGLVPRSRPPAVLPGPDAIEVLARQAEPGQSDAELVLARCYAELSGSHPSHLARAHQEAQQRSRGILSEEALPPDPSLWSDLNDTSHVARAHEEFLKRRHDSARKRDPATPGPIPSFRKNL